MRRTEYIDEQRPTLFLIMEMMMWIDRESNHRPNLVLARYRLKKVTIVSDAHKE